MKLVTICASYDDVEKVHDLKIELLKGGEYFILQPEFWGANINQMKYVKGKPNLCEKLMKIHLRKICESDIVYIILKNDGTIGESVKRELQYALENSKQVVFYENKN